MDISATVVPKSDQMNADDLLSGPRTITVTRVTADAGSAEQPVSVYFTGDNNKPYKPCKSMRRVIVSAWGKQSTVYAGRSLTLYRNPDITFGGEKVGGIEISHMSHIDKPLTLALTRARGKRTSFTVQPLREAPARDWQAEADAITDVDALRALHAAAKHAGAPAATLDAIVARGKALAAPATTQDEEATA